MAELTPIEALERAIHLANRHAGCYEDSDYQTVPDARSALAEVEALVAALEGTAFWHLAADGSLCWCRVDDLEPDDERHLPACKVARAALARFGKEGS